jgi:hypothetical protein
MPKLPVALWSLALLVGVVVLDRLAAHFSVLGWLGSFEAVHVVAHMGLYGTLMALCLASGMPPWRGASLTMFVAALQEGVQVYKRDLMPSRAEAFDLVVDAVAVVFVAWLWRWRAARSDASALPTIDDDARAGDPARTR